jgi:1-acyl-sn-glycerol-3-phosphate acyltransferase
MSGAWKTFRWPYDVVVTLVGYLYFGICSLVLSAFGHIVHRVSTNAASHLTGRRVVSAGFRSFLGLWHSSGLVSFDLSALDSLRGQPGLIIAPNHPSLFDAVVVMSRLPEITCIIKATLLDSPFLGGGAQWSAHISNDAGPGMIRQAAAELQTGGQLLIFPEGTRTKPGADKVNPFKGGFALMAREAQAPVQTIILRQTCAILGKGWPWWRIPIYPLTFRAELGRRFNPPAPSCDVRAWMTEMEAYFRSVI